MARTKSFDEREALEKILKLFWRKGYHQASLEDILLAAGIKKQSMYNAYGDKRSVFIKALRLYQEENSALMEQYVDDSIIRGRKATQILYDLFHVEEPPYENIKGCLMINSMVEFKEYDEDIRAEINTLLLFFEKILTRVVEMGQNSGEITTVLSCQQIVDIFMNMHRGFQVGKDYDILPEKLNQTAGSIIKLIKI